MKLKKQTNKFYNFWRDGVTQSMISKWLQCPRQAKLEYVEGWTSYEVSPAILFGNVCHHVLEHAYTEKAAPLAGNVTALIKGFEDELYGNGKNEPSLEVMQKNEFIFAQAEATLQTYFIKYKDDWLDNWIFTERSFKVPYVYPDGKTTFLRGKIDGAVIRKNKTTNKNELWIPDHKTSSMPNLENKAALLPVDLQIWFYLHASSQLPEFKGKKIAGFFINSIRRTGMKQTKKDITLRDYSTRLYTDIMSRDDHYFNRLNIAIKMQEVRNWKKNQLDPLMKDLRRWHESNYKWPGYFSPVALETKYGLANMAKAIASNDFTGLYQRETVFQEL